MTSPQAVAERETEANELEMDMQVVQEMAPIEGARDRLRDVDIPALETQIKEYEGLSPVLAGAAEKASVVTLLSFIYLVSTSAGQRKVASGKEGA
jgi:hypothetical protein